MNALLSMYAWLETGLVSLAGFCVQAPLALTWPIDKRKVLTGRAFRLAIETGADVLPVAVSGTRRALPKHSWRFATSRALVTVGKPISTQGMTLADVERLKEMTRTQILELRASLMPHTSAEGAAPSESEKAVSSR
jgi:1-acyl-sn-glycerol-3-phosphate acyltransferase